MRGQNTRLLLALLVLGGALHLPWLAEPRSVVFDEVHFGGFVSAYCGSGAYFFDVHPPHGKLLVAGVLALGGYRGGQAFEKLGEPLTEVSPVLLRLVPALAGTLLPVALFGFMLQLGASPLAAFLAGLAAALDNAVLVQTRILALDGILLVSTFAALACALAALRCPDRARRTGLALVTGLLAGLAAGTKFTGLAALALVGACILADLLAEPALPRLRRAASLGVWILSGAVGIYVAGWALHFALLTSPGPGDQFIHPTGNLLRDTVEVHRAMLAANYGLTATHPDASPWWGWPLMLRPVFYWSSGEASIYLVGNPAVWWGSALGMIVVLASPLVIGITGLQLRVAARSPSRRLWIPLLGWAISLGPLVAVPRPLFLYHYLTPLLFSLCLVILWLDRVGWTRSGGWRDQRASFSIAIGVLLLGFLATSPFTFSFVHASEVQRIALEMLAR